MKLKEFEIFQKNLFFNLDQTLKIVSLANECAFKLDEKKILDITNFMKRTIKNFRVEKSKLNFLKENKNGPSSLERESL